MSITIRKHVEILNYDELWARHNNWSKSSYLAANSHLYKLHGFIAWSKLESWVMVYYMLDERTIVLENY